MTVARIRQEKEIKSILLTAFCNQSMAASPVLFNICLVSSHCLSCLWHKDDLHQDCRSIETSGMYVWKICNIWLGHWLEHVRNGFILTVKVKFTHLLLLATPCLPSFSSPLKWSLPIFLLHLFQGKKKIDRHFLQCAIAEHLRCSVAAATVNRIKHGLHKHLPWQQCTGARQRQAEEPSPENIIKVSWHSADFDAWCLQPCVSSACKMCPSFPITKKN